MQGFPFSSWLYRIAHNQVVDHLRRREKQPATLQEELPIASDGTGGADPEQVTEHSFNMRQLLVATEKLTEAQREVISLRFTSDLSTAEVARIMGKSLGAVKALQHSAIIALRKALVVENE